MRFFAGIDGGQSSTVAVIGDENGRAIACGEAGPADEIGVTKESTRLHDALRGALDDARRRAKLPAETRFDAIVAGVSGYDGRVYGRAPQLPSDLVLLVHDTPIAHAGALGGAPGVIVIAGTGSVVYGRDAAGESWTLGGWGYLFGDEGSAFAIARDALRAIARANDEGDASLAIEQRAACDFFRVESPRRLVHAFYKGAISRPRLATFAQGALRFPAFRELAYRGADRLALLAARVVAAGAPPRCALVGGVFDDAGFRDRVSAGIAAAVPGAEIVRARYEPAQGALLLAYREAGREIAELRA